MSLVASRKWMSWLTVACLSMAVVSGCSNIPKDEAAKDAQQRMDEDSLEGLNRAIFSFNQTLDGVLIKPITMIYRGLVPEWGRQRVTNFLDNLYSPVTFANSILQGDPQNSFATLWRFIFNTTFGIGGLFDVATDLGLKNRPADLGQTFAFYGAGPGPYLVLPVIGPSNARDAFGRLGDAFLNPVNYAGRNYIWVSAWTATVIDARSNNMKLIDDIYGTSLDPYSTFRSLYMQKRASDIRRGKAARDKALEDAAAQRQ